MCELLCAYVKCVPSTNMLEEAQMEWEQPEHLEEEFTGSEWSNHPPATSPEVKWVTRAKAKAVKVAAQEKEKQSKKRNASTLRAAEEEVLLQSALDRLPTCVGLVPPTARSTDASHKLCVTGGIAFCWSCGCLTATNASRALQSVCGGSAPQGSQSKLRRLQVGKLPFGVKEWPEGGAAEELKKVLRVP